ncbi:MAG: PepSY domain-containing protein [Methylobacteriaceae bacterium]|nr:PepSY domain-containing protein [Methylobacteriaceae bacterium]
MRYLGIPLLVLAMSAAGGAAAQDDNRPVPERACFSAPETREKILANGLADPFALLRAQAAEQRAEAIAVKLCRQGDVYVYEIDLLRRDGRLIHSRVDARSGRPAAHQGRR